MFWMGTSIGSYALFEERTRCFHHAHIHRQIHRGDDVVAQNFTLIVFILYMGSIYGIYRGNLDGGRHVSQFSRSCCQHRTRQSMKLKELESILSQVEGFRDPKYKLEQYNTSAHLAARMVFTAHSVFGDIEDHVVADFGTGSGILAIAAEILGSRVTVGYDIDPDAISLASENASAFELDIDFVHCDISKIPVTETKCYDTILMNPPFGTRTKGIDVLFLQKAFEMCSGSVYSLHKSSTRDFLFKKASQCNVEAEVVATMRFDIPQMYKFHSKKTHDIEVDMLRFSV